MSLASLYPQFVVLNLIAIYPLDGVFAAKVHLLVDQRENLETSRDGHLKTKNTPFYLPPVTILKMASVVLALMKPTKGLFKRSQHVGPTSPNMVGCNMLASFEHYVGRCWLEFKLA